MEIFSRMLLNNIRFINAIIIYSLIINNYTHATENKHPGLHPIIKVSSISGPGELTFTFSNYVEGNEYCGGLQLGVIAKITTYGKEKILDCFDLHKEFPKILTVFFRNEGENFKHLYVLTSTYNANSSIDGEIYEVHKYDMSQPEFPKVKLHGEYICFDGYSYEKNTKMECNMINAGEIKNRIKTKRIF